MIAIISVAVFLYALLMRRAGRWMR
jgi:hypothetical protein